MRSRESQAIWREIRARQDLLRGQYGGCPARCVFAEAVDQVIEDMVEHGTTPTEYMEHLEAQAVRREAG